MKTKCCNVTAVNCEDGYQCPSCGNLFAEVYSEAAAVGQKIEMTPDELRRHLLGEEAYKALLSAKDVPSRELTESEKERVLNGVVRGLGKQNAYRHR